MRIFRTFVRRVLIACGVFRRQSEETAEIELDLPESDRDRIDDLLARVRRMEDEMISACLLRATLLPRVTGVPGLRVLARIGGRPSGVSARR